MDNFFLLLIDFYDFISLDFASIEKIYQALEYSVSSAQAMQTSCQKYSAARRISQLSSRCLDVPKKHVLLPNTILLSLLSIHVFYTKKQFIHADTKPRENNIKRCNIGHFFKKRLSEMLPNRLLS